MIKNISTKKLKECGFAMQNQYNNSGKKLFVYNY